MWTNRISRIGRILPALVAMLLGIGVAAPSPMNANAGARTFVCGWQDLDNTRYTFDGFYFKYWLEVQFRYNCATNSLDRVRVFGSARIYRDVTNIQMGMDNPSTPSARLGINSPPGGILDDNNAHYNTNGDCCVSVWTGNRGVRYAFPGEQGESYKGRIWISYRLSGALNYIYPYTFSTLINYVHGIYEGGAGGCTGAGCGGF